VWGGNTHYSVRTAKKRNAISVATSNIQMNLRKPKQGHCSQLKDNIIDIIEAVVLALQPEMKHII
jgi:hypothetical protein